MENEPITVTLSVRQWNDVLGVISTAPFNLVNRATDALAALQGQTGPQFEAAHKKHQAAEPDGGALVPEDAAA